MDTHITIPMARLIELETAEQERNIFHMQRIDLAFLVQRLIRHMRVTRTVTGAAPVDDLLERQALDYLCRKKLISPLRDEEV